MKRFALLATAALLVGCADSATDTVSNTETSDNQVATTETEANVDTGAMMASFESGESANLAIPKMHCPVMCFPKAKETLEEIDGIASVELVAQEEEGVINDHRVIVTFDGAVKADSAIAALDAVEFPGSSFEDTGATSEN